MTKPTGRRCTQCFKTVDKLTVRERIAWAEKPKQAICPRCMAKWGLEEVRPAKIREASKKCAGCSRRVKKLVDGVCITCTDAGISAPTLFD